MPVKNSPPRKTIGVFAAQLTRAWNADFMSGVMDAAEENNVSVVTVVGGKPVSLSAYSQTISHGIYDLIKPGQFDGLLLLSDIAHGLSAQEVQEFCDAYAPMPVVAHAVDARNIKRLMTDNADGMRSLVRHLIEEHGYKRIAFLRGLVGQIESDLRFDAYQQELKAHSIRFEKNLVVEGGFTTESGRNAIHELMDERAVRFQAVVAVNDRVAIGAIEALQQREIPVPDSVAVTGFDDVQDAQTLGVPLTTVAQPFYEMGRYTFETLLKRMNGEKVPEESTLPVSLKIRWSCGCLPESVRQAEVPLKEVARTGKLDNKRDAAVKALLMAANISPKEKGAKKVEDAFAGTWVTFLATLRSEDSSDAFLKQIQQSIVLLQERGREADVWHNIISTLRKHALGGITDHKVALRAENLFQQARMLAGELSQRAQAFRRLEAEKQEEALGSLGFSIAPAMSLDELGNALAKNLPMLGIKRWYLMFYSDLKNPDSISAPPPQSYRLLMQFEKGKIIIPKEQQKITTGPLAPFGKFSGDERYSAIIMPLSLARNRFGFMWAEVGPRDWEVYLRIRNLVSSALLRTMLVQQREQAQHEVERLLEEARQRAAELGVARDEAEKSANENARLYEKEQSHRRAMELLARASRQLSSLVKEEQVPQQILEQLSTIIQFDRGVVFLEDVNGNPRVVAHSGLPKNIPYTEIKYIVHHDDQDSDMYDAVARMKEAIQIGDTTTMKGWTQPEWIPADKSWLGVPLFYKNKVMGMAVVTRTKSWAYTRDDAVVCTAFAVQAAIALENARLYDEVTSFGQVMERMVEQRVQELNTALNTLEKLDKNKSIFIQVAAHELRTPLTVIKGYLGMFKADHAIQNNPSLQQAVEGVMHGVDRLHQIVNSMLDVARLENQVLTPHLDIMPLGPTLRLIQKDYVNDLAQRNLTLTIDETLKDFPPLAADSQLLQKALDQLVVNAIKFTPDGGSITISAHTVQDDRIGECAEIRIKDTGIGINPENHTVIFEKLYQLGKVEFHSSGRTNFKGGGPGLGLAIAAGIIKAHGGKVWVESQSHDEEKLPGSTFFVRIPFYKP